MRSQLVFETSRLQIFHWTITDAQEFFELTHDRGFNLFPITIYRQENESQAKEWIEKNAELVSLHSFGKYAVREKASAKLIGMGGLTPWEWEKETLIDVTYRLRESAWGKGLGAELAQGLIQYGFQEGLSQITATITPDNIASKKIASHLGMIFDRSIVLKGVATDLYRLNKTR